MIHMHKSPQSIDRIDRTVRKALISRVFVRAVLSRSIDRQWTITDRSRKYRPQSTVTDLLGLQVFDAPLVHCGRCGRYLDGLYGYISIMQANGACCQIIPRG
jgi:hypothetical protein